MEHPNQALILTLAKVLVATAWADGDLSNDEVNSMKRDLLTRIPALTARQWASVAIYMDAPVDGAERERLIQQLRSQATTPQGRQLVLAALDGLVAADGRETAEERRIVDEVRAAISSGGGRPGGMTRMFAGRSAPPPAASQAPDREAHLDDFIGNRVYYVVCRRLEQGGVVPRLADTEIRKLCLAGGLMAVVAQANPEVDERERAAMTAALHQHWPLGAEQAAFLTDVAMSQLPGDLDRFELARAFAAVSDPDERGHLLDALFAIAAADGAIVDDELETIRGLAKGMLLTHDQFIQAKLKVTRPEG